MHDLIFVSMEDWDHIWRRNQFLCSGLARRHPKSKILFVGHPRNVSHSLRRGRMANLRGESTWTVPDYPNITVTHPLKLMPNSLPGGRQFNDAMARRHINGVARRIGLKNSLLWLNPHYAVHMVGRMRERAVIYDITDDWTAFTQSSALTQLIVAQDAQLCRRADEVIVCSQKLFDLKRSLTSHLHLIPNGVDAEHYRCVLDGTGPLPDLIARCPRPVLGYTGTIHPDRVDLDLVEAIARRLPQASVVLIGPVLLGESYLPRFKDLPNVIFTGPIPYDKLPQYMRAFDVCITPHLVTSFTESLNPIKLWEYLAAGKPIVATDVAGFRDYPQFVRLAHDADSFVEAVQAALQEDQSQQQARRNEACRHSWTSRIQDVEQIMQSCLAPRREVAHAL